MDAFEEEETVKSWKKRTFTLRFLATGRNEKSFSYIYISFIKVYKDPLTYLHNMLNQKNQLFLLCFGPRSHVYKTVNTVAKRRMKNEQSSLR